MCGKVLITVKASQETYLMADIKDYLYLFDRNVSVKRTEFKGVLLIEGDRNSKDLAYTLINSPIPATVITTIVPILIEGYFTSINNIIDSISQLLQGITCTSFMVRCRLRDSPVGDEECEIKIRELLRNMGFKVILKGISDCVIDVQGLRNWFGVYVGSSDFIRV